jgi:hypothetical protein
MEVVMAVAAEAAALAGTELAELAAHQALAAWAASLLLLLEPVA